MQPKSRQFPFLFCSVLLTAGAVGCQPAPSVPDVAASQRPSVQLHIACPSEETATLVRSRGKSWRLRNGVKIGVHLYDPSKESGPSPEGGIVGGTPADVWILSPADLPRWAAAGHLLPLPDAYKISDNPLAWSDLLPAFREQLLQWDGKTYGLPLIGEAPLCCYRADLLKAPSLASLFARDLNGPATWEQFAQIAEHFRAKGVKGEPGSSLPPLPRSDAGLDRLFYTVAAGFARRAVPHDEARPAQGSDDLFSFHYDVETGQPRIDAAGFVHALKLLQRLQACRPAQAADHPEEAFRDGRAVLCLTDAPWLVAFQKTDALHDKIGVCRIPGGDRYFDFRTGQAQKPSGAGNWLPYIGGAGSLAVVPRSASNPEDAFALLAELAGPKTSMEIFLGSKTEGGPTRTSQLYRQRWDTFDLDDKQSMYFRDLLEETPLHRHLKNPVLCLRTPRQSAHRAVLVRGLREALLKGADAEKTLRNVAEEWRQLDREQGLEEHKADYRRSLGLLAKE